MEPRRRETPSSGSRPGRGAVRLARRPYDMGLALRRKGTLGEAKVRDMDVEPWAGPASIPVWLPRPAYDGMMGHDPQPALDLIDGLGVQAFMTGTDAGLFDALAGRAQMLEVDSGAIRPSGSPLPDSYRPAGWNSSIRFPAGSCTRICWPPGPLLRIPLKLSSVSNKFTSIMIDVLRLKDR